MVRSLLVVLLLVFSSICKNLVAAALRLWAILRSRRWITANRYPPTSLQLLVIQNDRGHWHLLFSHVIDGYVVAIHYRETEYSDRPR